MPTWKDVLESLSKKDVDSMPRHLREFDSPLSIPDDIDWSILFGRFTHQVFFRGGLLPDKDDPIIVKNVQLDKSHFFDMGLIGKCLNITVIQSSDVDLTLVGRRWMVRGLLTTVANVAKVKRWKKEYYSINRLSRTNLYSRIEDIELDYQQRALDVDDLYHAGRQWRQHMALPIVHQKLLQHFPSFNTQPGANPPVLRIISPEGFMIGGSCLNWAYYDEPDGQQSQAAKDVIARFGEQVYFTKDCLLLTG